MFWLKWPIRICVRVCRNCQKSYIKKTDKYGCCSRHCIEELKYTNFISLWLENEIDGGRKQISHFIRRYLFEKFRGRCSVCKWSKMNPFSRRIPLEVDHINGDRGNHQENNLRLLCPNCHSLTATYKYLNTKIGPALRQHLTDEMYNEHLLKDVEVEDD